MYKFGSDYNITLITFGLFSFDVTLDSDPFTDVSLEHTDDGGELITDSLLSGK